MINTSKSSVLFSSRQKRVALNLPNGVVYIYLNGTPINRNYETKLQWNSHISYISGKVAKCAGIIYCVNREFSLLGVTKTKTRQN